MTKRRDPLSFELALTRIAGLIGWTAAAKLLGQSERTVRNWSDPDTGAGINLDAALKLDVAYQAAGGDGTPMFDCYATRLQVETRAALWSSDALAAFAATSAKEGGEAIAASINAARPGASTADKVIAEREIEESIAALHDTLRCLRAGRGPDVASGEGE